MGAGGGSGLNVAAVANRGFPGEADRLPLCAQVCELGEQLQQEKARCEGLLRQDRSDVNQYFQTLEAALARKRRACLDALDEADADVRRVYDPLVRRVKELQVGGAPR